MSRWYRAYEGTVTDAKLAEVALIAGCSRSVAIAAWHCVLESCAATNDGGRFDCTPRRLAVILCEPVAAMQAVLAGFIEVGMVQGDVVPAWNARQFVSDSSTERSRKFRERRRNGDATLHDGCSNAPETETETESEAEKKVRGADAPANAVATPEENSRKGKRLDWDWLPSDATVAHARAEGLTDDEIDRAVTRFKNFYCTDTGKNSVRTDWNPVLRNWLSDDALKKRPAKATTQMAKAVPTIWIAEGSEAWAAVTKARGKPPLKTYRHGDPGAYVQPHEIPASENAA